MAVDRPEFDQGPRGYDRRQVDAYIAGLWRHAREAAARATAAEAALADERRRRHAEPADDAEPPDVGGRIGRMLQPAAEEAALIRFTARRVAEASLAGAIERAVEGSPIMREAREQADRLLMDAQEEANRRARRREQEAEARVARAAASVEGLRRRQEDVLSWLLRVRELLDDRELDRALTELARDAGGPRYGAVREGGRLADVDDAEVVPDELDLVDTGLVCPGPPGEDIIDAEIVEEDGGGSPG